MVEYNYFSVLCPSCGNHSSIMTSQNMINIKFKCRYCGASRKSRHDRQKFAGLQFKIYGPFSCKVAAEFTKEMNGKRWIKKEKN